MAESEPTFYGSRLTLQEKTKLYEQGVDNVKFRTQVQGLRRHLIGALMACDEILYGNSNHTIDIDKK